MKKAYTNIYCPVCERRHTVQVIKEDMVWFRCEETNVDFYTMKQMTKYLSEKEAVKNE